MKFHGLRKLFCLLLAALLLTAGGASAEKRQKLPDGNHTIILPDSMRLLQVTKSDTNLWRLFIGDNLELEIFLYKGNGLTLEENAQALVEAGKEAELRQVSDTVMLCYRDRDEADGAPCIGYVYEDGNRFVELTFWYGTEEAGQTALAVMESYQPLKQK